MQPLETKKSHTTSWGQKNNTSQDKKKSHNILGTKKIIQPLMTKKSCNIFGRNLTGQKKSCNLSGKKITQPMGQ